jgi:hypothetical protein
MKPHVLFDVLQLVAFLQILFGAVNAGGQIAEQLGRNVSRIDGVNFEDLAKFVQVANLLRGELANVGTAPGFDCDETFRFQPIECLADGRLADAELRGKRCSGR